MYRQILINVRLKAGNGGQKTERTGRRPLRRGRSEEDCSAIEGEEEGGGGEGGEEEEEEVEELVVVSTDVDRFQAFSSNSQKPKCNLTLNLFLETNILKNSQILQRLTQLTGYMRYCQR